VFTSQSRYNVLGINQVLGAVRWYIPQSWGMKLSGGSSASDDQFLRRINAHEPGETVTFAILRDSRPMPVKVRLQAFPYVPLGTSSGAAQ
jgi:hypothetical protein